jgi:hypothetical protein
MDDQHGGDNVTTPDRDELQRRTQLAHAILTQREPNRVTTTLALCALNGIPVELLVRHPTDICPDWTAAPSSTRAVIDAP